VSRTKKLYKNTYRNVEDVKDRDGNYLKSYVIGDDYYITRSSNLWYNMNTRCKVGGAEQKRNPCYIGVTHEFENYNSFTVWCNFQQGYLDKTDNGTFWQLDKDLITPGNKCYSPENCLFVPQDVNSLFVRGNSNVNLPLGVYMHRGLFVPREGGLYRGWLGYFTDPLEAHKVWQRAKVAKIEVLTEKYSSYFRLTEALNRNKIRLQNDIDNDQQTF